MKTLFWMFVTGGLIILMLEIYVRINERGYTHFFQSSDNQNLKTNEKKSPPPRIMKPIRRPYRRGFTTGYSLKTIGRACDDYSIDHDNNYPPDFTALTMEGYIKDPRVFITLADPFSKVSKDKTIRPCNTSFAYVGKGLSVRANKELPLAFENPKLKQSHQDITYVLLVSGSTYTMHLSGKNCKEIAKKLLKKVSGKVSPKERKLILDNAAKADEAR